LTYAKRLAVFLLIDSFIVLGSLCLSLFLVQSHLQLLQMSIMISSIGLLVCHHFYSSLYKLYKKAWEYASIKELLMIFKAVSLSVLTVAIIQVVLTRRIPFRVLAATWLIYLVLIGCSRLLWRMIRDTYITKSDHKKKTLIVGAGSAGTMVVRQLLGNSQSELWPIAFIDDSPSKQRLDILGVPVLGGVGKIEEIVKEHNISNIVIAIPSLSKIELNRIFRECSKTPAKTKILPMLEDLVTGKVSVNQFRDVQVEDLLGREPVALNMESISESISEKVVLVTGAGGSIGSEICRQILPFKPKKLVLLGHGENSIYSIHMELKEKIQDQEIELVPVIADLQDQERIQAVIKQHQPNVVYHAAAHKHVPLMEANPEEAVKNNILGTRNVAEAASFFGVNTFVMISSDKAVNPTSVMGATKRLAEMFIQYMDQVSLTRFVAVRFGNVLGSRGSVIPLFKNQIKKGGPITVTHPDMVRYFMTIPEASRLVLQAGSLAEGGEIFVLDMGEPVRIVDLAKNLIRLSGHSEEEIGVEFTGIRPGEKLFEELLNSEEVHGAQVHPQIYIGKTSGIFIEEINELINKLSFMGPEEIRNLVLEIANRRGVRQPLLSASS
jgi:FlaA1/EpsC-like NDP-sugar epimerase